MEINPESNNPEEYLKHDDVVNWRNPAILSAARDICRDAHDETQKARLLYEWVRDSIPHSSDIGADILTCSAAEVLEHRTGICFAKSHLLGALLRAVGIPSGFCYQVLRMDPPMDNTLILHGLNGIYLADLQKWMIVDARGNVNGINAVFNPEHPSLAYLMDPSSGERLIPTIFVSPLPHVVEKLKKYNTRQELWGDLPTLSLKSCVLLQCL